MNAPLAAMQQILEKLVAWARCCAEIRALVLIGSSARDDHGADEWSDLDFLVFVPSTERFLAETDWLKEVGSPILTFLEVTSDTGRAQRRVLFNGGIDVDFTPVSLEEIDTILHMGLPASVAELHRRGVDFQLDCDGYASRFDRLKPPAPSAIPPTLGEFEQAVNLYHCLAVLTCKKVCRGEIWTAMKFCDHYMKEILIRIVGWYARSSRGWEFDTWYEGRFVEQWAEPWVIARMGEIFAGYDGREVMRALTASLDLFRDLAICTGDRLDYPYPSSAEKEVRSLVELLVERDDFSTCSGDREAQTPAASLPTPGEFEQSVSDFLFHAVWTCKKVCRGEIWIAKMCCDHYMKEILIRMAAWHARSTRGEGFDIWDDGRFLEHWAEPWVIARMAGIFARYQRSDVTRALANSLEFFRELAVITGDRLGYPYPSNAEAKVRSLIAAYLGRIQDNSILARGPGTDPAE